MEKFSFEIQNKFKFFSSANLQISSLLIDLGWTIYFIAFIIKKKNEKNKLPIFYWKIYQF